VHCDQWRAVLVPARPVTGFVFPFVDQLLRCVPSPLLWRCGATYVPRFVVYALTEWLECDAPVLLEGV
jgi:hypothetical protein